jgi:hypothetical protein
MKLDLKTGALVLMAIALLLLSMRSCNKSNELSSLQKVNTALADSVHIFKDENGRMSASIDIIEIDRKGLLETINSKDEMIGKLQAVVASDKNATAAAVFRAEARGRASGVTHYATKVIAYTGVSSVDTTNKCPPCDLPIYKSEVHGDGITANVTAGPDSTVIDNYKIEQDFAVTFTSAKKKGLFAKRTKTVVVTALSKNGAITDVRSFQEPVDPPKRGLWAGIGAAVVVALKVGAALLL